MTSNHQASRRTKRAPKPLSAPALEELALSYVARFATSSAKLRRYLERKLRERGWEDIDSEESSEDGPDLSALVARFVEKGYVDDAAYARMRSSDLLRRGYGGNRVRQALGQAGITEELREKMQPGEVQKRRAALHLAKKRRFGPFGLEKLAPEKREKQIAAMLRAGHTFDHARTLIGADNETRAHEWLAEAEEWHEETDDDDFA